MKSIIKFVIAATLLTNIAYADDNCTIIQDKPTHCSCILNNAVTDCQNFSPIKQVCNPSKLSSYFKEDPAGAEAQCEKYRDKSQPDECIASVQYYDQNC